MSFEYNFQLILIIVLLFITSTQLLTNESTQTEKKDFFCKCMEYWECFSTGGQLFSYCPYSNEVCCMTNESIHYERSLPIIERKSAICGKKEFDSGIQEYAEPGEWAWHTAIMVATKDLYVCGGSLIDENWVLTAAHCIFNLDAEDLKVRIGEYDVLNTNEPEKHQEIGVKQLFLHSKFNSNSLVNDMALLLLKDSVKKSPNINIVCLPNPQIFTEERLLQSKCYITGWGKLSEGGEYSSVLKEVNVPLWNHSECQQSLRTHFGSNYNLSKTAICGGDVGHDACDGDGGGGLFCEYNQLWYQIGIISFGVGCGRENSPGVYTNVLSYLDWINYITANQSNSMNFN